jgi:hypothetical protein
MPLSVKERALLRIAAWALRTYLKHRKPSPPEPSEVEPLSPPRLESSRNTPTPHQG